jgi:hypothetical protein
VRARARSAAATALSPPPRPRPRPRPRPLRQRRQRVRRSGLPVEIDLDSCIKWQTLWRVLCARPQPPLLLCRTGLSSKQLNRTALAKTGCLGRSLGSRAHRLRLYAFPGRVSMTVVERVSAAQARDMRLTAAAFGKGKEAAHRLRFLYAAAWGPELAACLGAPTVHHSLLLLQGRRVVAAPGRRAGPQKGGVTRRSDHQLQHLRKAGGGAAAGWCGRADGTHPPVGACPLLSPGPRTKIAADLRVSFVPTASSLPARHSHRSLASLVAGLVPDHACRRSLRSPRWWVT